MKDIKHNNSKTKKITSKKKLAKVFNFLENNFPLTSQISISLFEYLSVLIKRLDSMAIH